MSNDGYDEQLREVVDRLQGEVVELRRSRKRLAEAADADRRAIERALHDGVQQHLVALAVDLRRLARLIDGDPVGAKALLDEIAANVLDALDVTAQLALRVYPPMLESRGLASALRAAAVNVGVTAVIDAPTSDYPPEIAATVYWFCVEALSSGSPGSQVSLTVIAADGRLTFDVEVDGHHSEGRLVHLRDRIEALDGRVSVDDMQEGGSRVHGWLPLSRRPGSLSAK
ncbi:MAG: histidine kinase [Candidatus Limnocylindrales bacterium]